MSRMLFATICLSTVLLGVETRALAAAEESAWLVRFMVSDSDDNPAFLEPPGQRLAIRRDATSGEQRTGAAAVLDLAIDVDDHFADPLEISQYAAGIASRPGTRVAASLGGAVGLRFGEITAGPFSSLTYSRFIGDGNAGPGRWETAGESLTGSFGFQTSARFGTGPGAAESRIRLSLDHDFDIDQGTLGQAAGSARRSIYMEEVDVTKFDLENAISLRIKGNVPGLFFYETKISVRSTGIRGISGRIKVKF